MAVQEVRQFNSLGTHLAYWETGRGAACCRQISLSLFPLYNPSGKWLHTACPDIPHGGEQTSLLDLASNTLYITFHLIPDSLCLSLTFIFSHAWSMVVFCLIWDNKVYESIFQIINHSAKGRYFYCCDCCCFQEYLGVYRNSFHKVIKITLIYISSFIISLRRILRHLWSFWFDRVSSGSCSEL